MKISFFIPGIPQPGGSKTAFKTPKGKVVVTESCKKNKPWRADVRQAAVAAYDGPPLTGPLELSVIFYMPRPKWHYGSGKNAQRLKDSAPFAHTNKPDRTKLLRALEDALTGIIWNDDTQIVAGECHKLYATDGVCGAQVFVGPYGEAE